MLPAQYDLRDRVELAEDTALMRRLAAASLLLLVGTAAAALPFHPLSGTFGASPGWAGIAVPLLTLLIGIFLYYAAHELVHGLFMRLFGTERVRYGVRAGCAYAGCGAYFTRRHYIIIALAPVILWGAVFSAAAAVCPPRWFWVFWLLQAVNVSGAVGDFYMTVRVSFLPATVRIRDTGMDIMIWDRTEFAGTAGTGPAPGATRAGRE